MTESGLGGVEDAKSVREVGTGLQRLYRAVFIFNRVPSGAKEDRGIHRVVALD